MCTSTLLFEQTWPFRHRALVGGRGGAGRTIQALVPRLAAHLHTRSGSVSGALTKPSGVILGAVTILMWMWIIPGLGGSGGGVHWYTMSK